MLDAEKLESSPLGKYTTLCVQSDVTASSGSFWGLLQVYSVQHNHNYYGFFLSMHYSSLFKCNWHKMINEHKMKSMFFLFKLMIKIYKDQEWQLTEHISSNLTCTARSRQFLFEFVIMIFHKICLIATNNSAVCINCIITKLLQHTEYKLQEST